MSRAHQQDDMGRGQRDGMFDERLPLLVENGMDGRLVSAGVGLDRSNRRGRMGEPPQRS